MPEQLSQELQKMKEAELLVFIQDTIAQLDLLASRLENYVASTSPPDVGFDTSPQVFEGSNETPEG